MNRIAMPDNLTADLTVSSSVSSSGIFAGRRLFIQRRLFFRSAVILAGTIVLLTGLFGCSQQNATYQMNRARGSNLDSGELLEKSSKAVQRIDQINVELASTVEALRTGAGRVQSQAERCEAEAGKVERKFGKKSSVSKKPGIPAAKN